MNVHARKNIFIINNKKAKTPSIAFAWVTIVLSFSYHRAIIITWNLNLQVYVLKKPFLSNDSLLLPFKKLFPNNCRLFLMHAKQTEISQEHMLSYFCYALEIVILLLLLLAPKEKRVYKTTSLPNNISAQPATRQELNAKSNRFNLLLYWLL